MNAPSWIRPGWFVDYSDSVTVRGVPIGTGRRVALVVEVAGRTVRAITNGPRPGVARLDVSEVVAPVRVAKLCEVDRMARHGSEFGFSTSARHVRAALRSVRDSIRAERKMQCPEK